MAAALIRIRRYSSSLGLGVLVAGVLTLTVKVPSWGGESSSSEDGAAATNGESDGSANRPDPLGSGICTESVGVSVWV